MNEETFRNRTGITHADMAILTGLPFLTKLGPEIMIALFADAAVRHYPNGNVLFFQDDPADRFFVVFDGWVKIFRHSASGHESILHVASRGDSFAEAAIFDSNLFPVTAQAVADSRLLSIPADPFIARLREDADLCLVMLGALSRHNRFLVQSIEQISVKSSSERLAVFLESLCRGNNNSCDIMLPLDKNLIAGKLGMQPETLSRGFAKLRDIGVKTKGNKVIVTDVRKLSAFAGDKQD